MLVCEKGLFYFVGVGLFFGFAFQMVRIVLNIYNKQLYIDWDRGKQCMFCGRETVNRQISLTFVSYTQFTTLDNSHA
jgi:hypothetical protein